MRLPTGRPERLIQWSAGQRQIAVIEKTIARLHGDQQDGATPRRATLSYVLFARSCKRDESAFTNSIPPLQLGLRAFLGSMHFESV